MSRTKTSIDSSTWAAVIAVSVLPLGCGAGPQTSSTIPLGPSLPLPELTARDLEMPWPEGQPVANSVRAWHYNRAMVGPIQGRSSRR